MRWIIVVGMAGLTAGCGSRPSADDFEARALGAAYAQFPNSAVNLVVSHSSGRSVACGFARNMDGSTPEPGKPFIWADGEMYSGGQYDGIKESEVIRLCGPHWVAPRRFARPLSPPPGADIQAETGRSPAA